MSENNIENWEQELKHQLGNHREATDAKDLDAFMDKLEDNKFFDQKGKKPFLKWSILAALLLIGGTYWLWSEDSQTAIPSKPTSVIEPEIIEKKTEEINAVIRTTEEQGTEVAVEAEETEKTVSLKNEKESVAKVEVILSEKEDKVEDEVLIEALPKTETETDATTNNLKEEKKVTPAPRKPIIIMSTDTTVVIDTSHVKHRKKDKKQRRK